MRAKCFLSFVLLAALISLPVWRASAVTNTWTGTGGDTDWFNAGNWDQAQYPQDGEDVVVGDGTFQDVLLTNSTASLASFVISNGCTMTFSNWVTTLNATNVMIEDTGTFTLPAAYADGAMSNRVHIVCTNFLLNVGGSIDVDERGYLEQNGVGKGANGGATGGGGAGHAGMGGAGSGAGGAEYGSIYAPLSPGSGGGAGNTVGGDGAGAVWIEATNGTVTIHGTIAANGGNGVSRGAGGSGGSIYIQCREFRGSTNGLLQVHGGNGQNNQYSYSGGGGSAGRIAVVYDTAAQASVSPPGVRFSTSPGLSGYPSKVLGMGADGTVYLPNTALMSPVLRDYLFTDVDLYMNGITNWNLPSLDVSNCTFTIRDPITLIVTNDILVSTGADMGVWLARSMYCAKLTVTNSAALRLYSSPTNATYTDYGSLVTITGLLDIATGSWLYPYSDYTNGGSIVFRPGDVNIAQGGGISATNLGFKSGYGRGKGSNGGGNGGGGGAHGGDGGDGATSAVGGNSYGSSNAPVLPGSPGGNGYAVAANGGGVIRIETITGSIVVDGSIIADGGPTPSRAGGSAGGSIFIVCNSFTGSSNGIVSADGMNGNGTQDSYHGGGGGGGRVVIAVDISQADLDDLLADNQISNIVTYSHHVPFGGTVSATNGTAHLSVHDGTPGTWHFVTTMRALSIEGSPTRYGDPVPRAYGTHINIPSGTTVTNAVASPTGELNGLRRASLGWDLDNWDGSDVTGGSSTQAVFVLSTNMVLTWGWTNEWYLDVSFAPNGSVNTNVVNGWYTNGLQVTNILATPSNNYVFSIWVGDDVPAGKEADNPLTVTMDQARTIHAGFASANGTNKSWNGVGVWESFTNWTPQGMPGTKDDVMIQSGTVLFGNSRSVMSVVVSNGATMVFTNWMTTLTSSNVIVRSGGTIALPAAYTNGGMSNSIHIVCTNFLLEAGGTVDAEGRGYYAAAGQGSGSSGNNSGGGGASHGGAGGMNGAGTLSKVTYGSRTAPKAPGSGGGNTITQGPGGSGGGAVWISATGGIVTVNGTINASASTATSRGGGGSGGSIFIQCQRFRGDTNGLLSASGTDGVYNSAGYQGGGGGGGRIAVVYDKTAQASEPRPGVRWSVASGEGGYDERVSKGEDGTLYLSDTAFLTNNLTDGIFTGVRLYMDGVASWSVPSLFVSNCSITFGDQLDLTVGNDIVVDSGGRLGVTPNTLFCGGDLIVRNGGSFYVYGSPTNGLPNYGALVDVTGDISIGAGSWIYPCSHPTNGGSALFRADNVFIAENAGFNAADRGFRFGYGSGKGSNGGGNGGGGGAYGGDGGDGAGGSAGSSYGVSNAPVDAGSPGGNGYWWAWYGGGVVRIEALQGEIRVDGTITANGGVERGRQGGCAGGSIFLACGTLTGGTNGVISADGTDGNNPQLSYHSGGAGGGRVAIVTGLDQDDFDKYVAGQTVRRLVTVTNFVDYGGSISATNGVAFIASHDGQPGTIVLMDQPSPPGTIFILR